MTNGNGGGPAGKPDKPTDGELDSFTGTYGAVRVQCVKVQEHVGKISKLSQHKDGYTLSDVLENDGHYADAPAGEYPWMCVLTLNNQYWVDLFNRNYANKWGTHYLDERTGEVSAVWFSDGTSWYYKTEEMCIRDSLQIVIAGLLVVNSKH